jgi:hypothetical protein
MNANAIDHGSSVLAKIHLLGDTYQVNTRAREPDVLKALGLPIVAQTFALIDEGTPEAGVQGDANLRTTLVSVLGIAHHAREVAVAKGSPGSPFLTSVIAGLEGMLK